MPDPAAVAAAFDPADLPGPAVIVDASTASGPLWAGPFLSVLEAVAARFGPAVRVAFLGGPSFHPVAEVAAAAEGRPGPLNLARELGRGAALGPSLLPLLDAPRPLLLLLGGATLIDRDDWADCGLPVAIRYRFGGEVPAPLSGWTECGADADLADILEKLADPVTHLRLGGRGLVATAWDAPGLVWERGELVGAPAGPASARFLRWPGSATVVTATITHESGRRQTLKARPAEVTPDPAPLELSAAEGAVLRQWSAGRGFYCSLCRRAHEPGAARCRDGAAGLLPTLGSAGAFELTPDGPGWLACPLPHGVTALGGDQILGPGARLYDWSAMGLVPRDGETPQLLVGRGGGLVVV